MPRLLIDCTRTVASGLHTGIQRHVRRTVAEAVAQRPGQVQAVVWSGTHWQPLTRLDPHPLDARQQPVHWPDPAPPAAGDTLLCADALWHGDYAPALRAARHQGLHLHLLCHDVLPATRPDWFPAHLPARFRDYWALALAQARGVACVSAHSQRALLALAHAEGWAVPPSAVIPPGVDRLPPVPEDQLPQTVRDLLAQPGPLALQVGTVEPRKGHAFLLTAFEALWAQGHATHWVIVGQPGWGPAVTSQRLRAAQAAGHPLHWFSDLPDTALHALYQRADVLLAAAEDEGFGLPVAEAQAAGLPVLLRDTPIHREVATPDSVFLPPDIAAWVAHLPRHQRAPHNGSTAWRNWSDATAALIIHLHSSAGQLPDHGIAG